MSKCDLDLGHPKFRPGDDQSLKLGLEKLRETLAKDHKLSGWVNHPMPGYHQFQQKIWKWDFAPDADRSGTRKGWRLYAYVPDPEAPEPIPAVAFMCYDKSDAPSGNHTKFVAQAIKKFLEAIIKVKVVDNPFRRQTNQNGEIISLCENCFELVLISPDEADIDIAEGVHECSGGDIAPSAKT